MMLSTVTLARLKRQENAHFHRAKGLNCVAERFNPVEMFERDNWTCGICETRINPEAKGPGAPSIDHRPALASGGSHTLAGARAAHLGCNLDLGRKEDTTRAAKTKRQARITGQQARRAAGKTKSIPRPPVSRLSKAAQREARDRMEQQRARREGNRNV